MNFTALEAYVFPLGSSDNPKGLSKNYVAKNEGVKSTRFSSLADTIFPVNRLSGSSVGGNDFLVFGRRK